MLRVVRSASRSGSLPDTECTRSPWNSGSAVRLQLDDQAVQERHRVDLRLIGQAHPALERERHVGVVLP